jgi:hypothetical protein
MKIEGYGGGVMMMMNGLNCNKNVAHFCVHLIHTRFARTSMLIGI